MSFFLSYQNALTLQAAVSPEFLPENTYFAGVFYELCEAASKQLPTVLSGGSIEITSELTLSYKPLDCRMLLYTKEGSGSLHIHSGEYELKPGSLLYLNCSDAPFSLHTGLLPWRYIVFFLSGELFPIYESLVPFETFLLTQPDPHAPVLRHLQQLFTGSTDGALGNKLRDAGFITSIITELFTNTLPADRKEENCAPYLLEIRHYIDNFYREPLRLDVLEERYHMSKYHICHSFSGAFGIPPLKYLNKKRLEAAENLLFSSDKKIHEIALAVGYESTNHFINLFKKEYGTTPQSYREAHQS